MQLMEIESSWNCKNDSVEIYDGSNQYGRLLAKICGSSVRMHLPSRHEQCGAAGGARARPAK